MLTEERQQCQRASATDESHLTIPRTLEVVLDGELHDAHVAVGCRHGPGIFLPPESRVDPVILGCDEPR